LKTFIVCVSYQIEETIGQLKKMGAHVCGSIVVPFWNIWDEEVGEQTAIIYQNKKELEI